MKYKRLTKEQFEAMHIEFANFLATQSIDKKEWVTLKQQQPAIAEQELDVFSDLIWEGVLTNAKFLEHFSPQHLFLFQCHEDFMQSIVIKSNNSAVDFMTKSGLSWLSDHVFTPEVEVFTGNKNYSGERNAALFDLILQGAILSDGQLYVQFSEIVNPTS